MNKGERTSPDEVTTKFYEVGERGASIQPWGLILLLHLITS